MPTDLRGCLGGLHGPGEQLHLTLRELGGSTSCSRLGHVDCSWLLTVGRIDVAGVLRVCRMCVVVEGAKRKD